MQDAATHTQPDFSPQLQARPADAFSRHIPTWMSTGQLHSAGHKPSSSNSCPPPSLSQVIAPSFSTHFPRPKTLGWSFTPLFFIISSSLHSTPTLIHHQQIPLVVFSKYPSSSTPSPPALPIHVRAAASSQLSCFPLGPWNPFIMQQLE